MSKEDKIEEEIEKMISRRNAIWNDLKTHADSMSAASQLTLISEVAVIDNVVREMKQQLEDMGWNDFMNTAWNGEPS